MCVEQADQGWREYAREFVKFWGPMALIAVILCLGTDAYFLRDDLKKAQCGSVYWKSLAYGGPREYCPPGCRCMVRGD